MHSFWPGEPQETGTQVYILDSRKRVKPKHSEKNARKDKSLNGFIKLFRAQGPMFPQFSS